MPKVKISEYSATANSNTDVASINIDEGCAPSGINNAIRAVMGHLKDFQQGTNGDPFNGPVNGTVGATTPSTGAFTTLSATGVTTVQAGTASLPAITTTGDTNTGIFFSAADTINFSTGGADKARISSDGHGVFTVGTQSSVARIGTDYGTLGAWGSAGGGLRIYRGTGAGVSIGTIYADSTGLFVNGNEATPLVFSTNATERARFNAGAPILCLSGGSTTATGTGIAFPSTQSASSDANTLDDYEEGTFTPTIVYSGTNTPTYNTQLGRYTKIGRVVSVQITLSWNENGSTGNVTVGALPFTAVTSNARAIPSVLSFGLTGLPTSMSVTGFVNTNATTMSLFLNDNAATTLTATYTDNDQDLYITVTYETA